MATRIFLRLEYPEDAKIGPSRAAILEAIDSHGSIKAAATAVGMSPRQTWALVNILNKTFGDLVTVKRGRLSGGASLTDKGRKLVLGYRDIEGDIYKLCAEKIVALEQLLEESRPPRRGAAHDGADPV